MKKRSGNRFRRILKWINSYFAFFLLVAFVITSCMMLFISIMVRETGLELTDENLGIAAKWTFLNVLLLAALFTAIDGIRRHFTVTRPARRILDATERIMQGDLSVRIPVQSGHGEGDPFSEIAEGINRMAEELSGIETLRSDFISNVSHEIKTPLAVIQNYCAMLSDERLGEAERKDYTATVTRASQNLSSLITNILRLSKLENRQIYPAFSTCDLSEQLTLCVLDFEDMYEKKQLELDCDIAPDIHVKTDPEMLTLVWNNLLSNAVKFTEPGGRVGVTLEREDDHATVTVSDTGCGIPREVGEHMFEKFYQGDTSHATEGNGLGLTLVKRIVDIMGCEIAVRSEVGVGTAFTVRIKCEEEAV